MTALMVAEMSRDGRVGRVPALAAATPGLVLRRERAGMPCGEEACGHPEEHGQRYEHCPDEGWTWFVATVSGMRVMAPYRFRRREQAAALAAGLALWPVDWTAEPHQLRALTESALGQDHLRLWLSDAYWLSDGLTPQHMPCVVCPPLPAGVAA